MSNPSDAVDDDTLAELLGSVISYLSDLNCPSSSQSFEGGFQFLPATGVEREAAELLDAMRLLALAGEQHLQGLGNLLAAVHRAGAVYFVRLFSLAIAQAATRDRAEVGDGTLRNKLGAPAPNGPSFRLVGKPGSA